jgi:peptidyl-prolyl cis-trans isomerase D
MLQQIRDKITGWFAIAFLGAIAIVFIFWGIQFESSVDVAAAKVNGEKISMEAVRRAWQNRQSELQQVTRDELPEALVQSEQARLLDDFIRRELLLQRADELGYRVSDRELAEALAALPALQVDGRFSRDRYAALLRSQGRTEADFEQEFRRDLEISQLSNAIGISAFALPGELRRRMAIEGETREVDVAIVPAARFADDVTVAASDVADWYHKNKADYQTPESVNLQYVRLDLADVAAGIEVTDESLRQYYDQVAPERYVTTERRRGRHILVESGADDDAARAKADALAGRVRAGEDFASLAAENSDDPGSKAQGGDLGWATRESFVGPFADALFGMEQGEISGPVKTQFGYHIIRLDEIDPSHQQSFEDVRDELEADYRQDRAQTVFYERSQELADEAFASLSELDSVARKLGMELRTADGFTRQGGAPFDADRKVIAAAFSDEVLQERQNSPAIAVGDESVVVLRVTEHQLPAQRPLEEVQASIEARLREQGAGAAAEAAARAAAARLAAGDPWVDVTRDLGVSPAETRTIARGSEDVPPALSKAVFAVPVPAGGGSANGTAVLANGDSALFVVNAVTPGTLPTPQAGEFAQLAQQAAGGVANAEFSAYIAELERTAKVVRNPKVFEQ